MTLHSWLRKSFRTVFDSISLSKPEVLQPQTGESSLSNIQCPVCGYYCLGHGGVGCIDKPFLVFGSKIPKV